MKVFLMQTEGYGTQFITCQPILIQYATKICPSTPGRVYAHHTPFKPISHHPLPLRGEEGVKASTYFEL